MGPLTIDKLNYKDLRGNKSQKVIHGDQKER